MCFHDSSGYYKQHNQPFTFIPKAITTDWTFVGFGLGDIYTHTNRKISDRISMPQFILGREWNFKMEMV